MSDFLQNEDDEFLTRVVVDTHLSKFYLYSSVGHKRTVYCDADDQYTRVLDLIAQVDNEDIVAYQ